jgi:hypothetical protein
VKALLLKLLGLATGNRVIVVAIAHDIYETLGSDIFRQSPEVRLARIEATARVIIERRWPQYSRYLTAIIDYVRLDVDRAVAANERK